MKYRKLLSTVLAVVLAVTAGCFPAIANAKETNTHPQTKIKLDDLYVYTNYDPKDISIERQEKSNEVIATIKDKKTGKILEIFGEKSEPLRLEALHTDGYTFTHTLYKQVVKGPAKAGLYCVLEMYKDGSFGQINRIKNSYWKAESSGPWHLEDTQIDANMPTTPSTSATVYGSANMVVTTTSSTTGSFSISALESVGFSVSQSTGSTWYARLGIEASMDYSIY